MRWLLQNNIYSEDGWDRLTTALTRQAISYSVHKCIPFAGTLEPVPDIASSTKVMAMGSYTLAKYAQSRWRPGAWLENLDFDTQVRNWGSLMLNYGSVVCRLDEVLGATTKDRFFIRPVHDTKSFTGTVMDRDYFASWLERLRTLTEADGATVTPSTRVTVGVVRKIYNEWRTWVIPRTRDRVVTSSQYKQGTLKRYAEPEQTDRRVTDFARRCIERWYPNDAFVLDVGETNDGLKIVEINNLNSSGFYKADMNRLVHAIQETFA